MRGTVGWKPSCTHMEVGSPPTTTGAQGLLTVLWINSGRPLAFSSLWQRGPFSKCSLLASETLYLRGSAPPSH